MLVWHLDYLAYSFFKNYKVFNSYHVGLFFNHELNLKIKNLLFGQ